MSTRTCVLPATQLPLPGDGACRSDGPTRKQGVAATFLYLLVLLLPRNFLAPLRLQPLECFNCQTAKSKFGKLLTCTLLRKPSSCGLACLTSCFHRQARRTFLFPCFAHLIPFDRSALVKSCWHVVLHADRLRVNRVVYSCVEDVSFA